MRQQSATVGSSPWQNFPAKGLAYHAKLNWQLNEHDHVIKAEELSVLEPMKGSPFMCIAIRGCTSQFGGQHGFNTVQACLDPVLLPGKLIHTLCT